MKDKKWPEDGDTRIVKCFAWLPTKRPQHRIWLKHFFSHQKFTRYYGDPRNHAHGEWRDLETDRFMEYSQ